MNKILIDRATVEQALEALETPIHEQSFMQKQNASTNLRAALAEPVQEPKPVVSACLGPLPAPAQPAEPEGYMPGCLWPLPATPDYYTAEQMREYALRALAEPEQEPDLSRCPKCGGPSDNVHDREVPPNPYYCTKCMAEPVAWRWGYRSVTTGEMDWRGYVEIAAHPNLRSPAIIMEPLYTASPQNKENT